MQLGASLTMGYFAQQSLDGVLDADLTILEQLQHDFPQDGIGSLRSLAGAFQFSGDDVDKDSLAVGWREVSVGDGSDALQPSELFEVLDEPTNHLDLATKEMLIDQLKEFRGHDGFLFTIARFCVGWVRACWNSAAGTGGERTPRVYPGSYIEYVQTLGHEAPGIYS